MFLKEGTPRWHTGPALPESPLYLFHVGSAQPTVAGLFEFLLVNPVTGYLLVVMARLLVAFSCFCRALAEDPSLLIQPAHEDRAGGLQPVGRTSLLHSLFMFAVGLLLAGLTLGEFVVNAIFRRGAPASSNLWVLTGFWASYIVIATLLFFLPVWFLRAKMAEAKENFLRDLNCRYAETYSHLQETIQGESYDDAIVARHLRIGKLIRNASAMAVWPFDKQTFLRFGGMLVTPVSPLIADQLPYVLEHIKTYLMLGALRGQ
jgi:hypothetical protein